MAVLSSTNRRRMWFGTEDVMRWIPAPLSGAEMGAEGAHSDATLLNGGGFAQHSWGSHRVYDFEWADTSSREAAQLMKSYRDGTYGRGLIHFQDPLTYDLNVLPARWADPSMALGDEGSSLVYGIDPTSVPTTSREENDLPVRSAQYDLSTTPVGFRGVEDSIFIPIPEGFRLLLGAFYSAPASAGVYVTEVGFTGSESAPQRLPALANDSSEVVNTTISGVKGVRLWVGRMTTASAIVSLTAMTARLQPLSEAANPATGSIYGYGEGEYGLEPYGGVVEDFVGRIFRGPWIGGMGHSGCKFLSVPAYVANSGVGGGQIGYAVSLREVGTWIYG